MSEPKPPASIVPLLVLLGIVVLGLLGGLIVMLAQGAGR